MRWTRPINARSETGSTHASGTPVASGSSSKTLRVVASQIWRRRSTRAHRAGGQASACRVGRRGRAAFGNEEGRNRMADSRLREHRLANRSRARRGAVRRRRDRLGAAERGAGPEAPRRATPRRAVAPPRRRADQARADRARAGAPVQGTSSGPSVDVWTSPSMMARCDEGSSQSSSSSRSRADRAIGPRDGRVVRRSLSSRNPKNHCTSAIDLVAERSPTPRPQPNPSCGRERAVAPELGEHGLHPRRRFARRRARPRTQFHVHVRRPRTSGARATR